MTETAGQRPGRLNDTAMTGRTDGSAPEEAFVQNKRGWMMGFSHVPNGRKSALRACAVLISTGVVATPVIAQNAPAPLPTTAGAPAQADDTIGDIVVTAQRRSESVQSTAVAISALSSDALAAKSIVNPQDLTYISPSVQAAAYQGDLQVHVRGVGIQAVTGGFDSSVALHLDGVYLARSPAAVSGLVDVDRVEVVRGPQGTLYGRNATGGSLNFLTKDPTSYWTGDASLTLGNYQTVNAFAAVGGPISDKVEIRIAAQTNNHEGYTRFVVPASASGSGDRFRGENRKDVFGRVKVLFKPTDNVSLLIAADYYKADDRAVVYQFFNNGYANSPTFFQLQSAAQVTPFYSRNQLSSGVRPYNKPEYWGVSGKLTVDLGPVTLTSLTAFRRTNPLNYDDISASSVFLIDQLKGERDRQFSQELQLGSNGSGPFKYVVGAYYFNEKNDVRNEYNISYADTMFGIPENAACCRLYLNGRTTTKAYAAFGQASYELVNDLSVIVGGRYSREKRGGFNDVRYEQVPAFINQAQFDPDTFAAFTPKVGLEYRASRQAFLYATVSKGFKSGGFNVGSTQNDPFQPEKLWAYEAGTKLDLFNRKLRVNIAGFLYDYKNLQVQDVKDQGVIIRNAATARLKGIEVESIAQLTSTLRLDANAAWLDAKFDRYNTVNLKAPQLGLQNLSGNRLPQAPEWKVQVGLEQTFALANAGSLAVRGDAAWQDRIFFTAFNESFVTQPSYWWLKARMTYRPAVGGWSVAAYVDNIADVRVIANASTGADVDGSRTFGNLAPPRTYGVTFGYHF